jgi:uncharacterized protein (TIGR03437 family)
MKVRRNTITMTLCSLALLVLGLPLHAQVAIVNAASFQPNFPVSPGSLASAFALPGTSFTGATEAIAGEIPLPATLGGVQIEVDGTASPLIYASAAQVNFQIPSATTPGRHPVRVTVNGTQVATGNIDVIATGPGLFVLDTTNPAQPGAVVNADGSINGADNPAAAGDTVLVYGTGLGPLDTPVPDGQAPTGIVSGTAETKVLFTSEEATVVFSGLAPNFVGLWQLNVTIPDESFITGPVPVVVIQGGISTNAVTIWVD